MTTLSPAPSPASPSTDPTAVEFLLALGRALHSAGVASYQLEDTLARIAQRLGVTLQVFAIPTGIFVAFGPPERQRTSLLRVEPGAVNLEQIAALDAIGDAVARGRLSVAAGCAAVAAVISAPPRYGPALIAGCYAFAAAAVAVLLGGGVREVVVSGAIGLAAGSIAVLAQRHRLSDWLTTFIAAVLAGLAAAIAGQTATPATSFITIGSGLIVLMPGLTLTTAINELASRHLAAGAARLASAGIALLAIGFGAALGSAIGQLAPTLLEPTPLAPLPRWTALPALLVFAVAFLVMFGARPRDSGWIALSVLLAYGGAQIGALVPG
ncbi:MAG: threonine/serine exporter family protein, partial [Dehalococcoidia bacterium]|nr:threonine/serine exporter family protein [Dehalococcoidia bacterium]